MGVDSMELSKLKICIDAGHYGKYNPCPSIKTYYESEVMWKLSRLQAKYLESVGVEVVHTRSVQSKDLSLNARGSSARGCDLFISNHSNAVGSYMDETIDYPVVYGLVSDKTTNIDEKSMEIGRLLADVIAKTMNTKQAGRVTTRKSSSDKNKDGVLNDNYYGVLHGSRVVDVPGLILEHSFHTNTKSVQWLLNDDNLEKLAKAEVEVILSYLSGSEFKFSNNNTSSQQSPNYGDDLYFSVQCGAYKIKQNAYDMIDKLKKAGYQSILKVYGDTYKVQCGVYRIRDNAVQQMQKLKASGFDAIIVNTTSQDVHIKQDVSLDEVAKLVIQGVYGNGVVRKQKLEAEGYNYQEVQKRVNALIKS